MSDYIVYVIRQLILAFFVLLGATLFAFMVSRATGDPVKLMAPENASAEQLDLLRIQLGLDKPLLAQYGDFLIKVAQGDLGMSIRQRQPVAKLIFSRLPATLLLAVTAMILSILISFPLGIFIALRRGSIWDLLGTSISLIGQAVPGFWLGLMAILVLGVHFRLLPIAGSGSWKHLIMPSFTLALLAVGRHTRLIRSAILEVLGSDFIRTAKGKGLHKNVVIWKHTLRNALIPVVTMMGLEFGALMSGAFITEMVFAWPGLGRLAVNAVYERDFPIVQGAVLVSAAVYVLVNLIVDLLYAKLDPRISYR